MKLASYLAYHSHKRPGIVVKPCNFNNFRSSQTLTKKISVNLNYGLQVTSVIAEDYSQTHLGRKTSQEPAQAVKKTHHKKIGVHAEP